MRKISKKASFTSRDADAKFDRNYGRSEDFSDGGSISGSESTRTSSASGKRVHFSSPSCSSSGSEDEHDPSPISEQDSLEDPTQNAEDATVSELSPNAVETDLDNESLRTDQAPDWNDTPPSPDIDIEPGTRQAQHDAAGDETYEPPDYSDTPVTPDIDIEADTPQTQHIAAEEEASQPPDYNGTPEFPNINIEPLNLCHGEPEYILFPVSEAYHTSFNNTDQREKRHHYNDKTNDFGNPSKGRGTYYRGYAIRNGRSDGVPGYLYFPCSVFNNPSFRIWKPILSQQNYNSKFHAARRHGRPFSAESTALHPRVTIIFENICPSGPLFVRLSIPTTSVVPITRPESGYSRSGLRLAEGVLSEIIGVEAGNPENISLGDDGFLYSKGNIEFGSSGSSVRLPFQREEGNYLSASHSPRLLAELDTGEKFTNRRIADIAAAVTGIWLGLGALWLTCF